MPPTEEEIAREADELDSKEVKRSGTYFLGGRVLTLADVEKEMPKESILISNMRCNDIEKVVVSNTPWKSVHPLGKNDVVLAESELGSGKCAR